MKKSDYLEDWTNSMLPNYEENIAENVTIMIGHLRDEGWLVLRVATD